MHVVTSPLPGTGPGEAPRVAFLFPGQGSQYVDMAREVATEFPVVRRTFELADEVLDGRLGGASSGYVFPPPAFTPDEREALQQALTETDVAQPALGATELAYLRLLRELGVEPDMTAGHSYGEFVALAAAGAMSEEDMLRISEARGRFIREEAAGDLGTMAGINAAPEALAELLTDPDIHLANLNSPRQTVVAGGQAAIDRALAWCRDQRIGARQLPVACAFHSPYVAPAQRRLAELLATTALRAPRIPVFSNTTAAPYPRDAAQLAGILGNHLVRPVRFVDEVRAMHEAGARLFVEVGPKTVLTNLVGAILGDAEHVRIAVDASGRPGHRQLLECLATLVSEGVPLRLDLLTAGRTLADLDARALAAATPRLSPATWLVNGGSARPAHAPVPKPVPAARSAAPAPGPAPSAPSTVPVTEVKVNGHPTANGSAAPPSPPAGIENGHAGSLPATAPFLPQQSAQPAVPAAPGPLASPATGDLGATEVMCRYQDVMQHFLESQRAIMLAYLGTPDATRAAPRLRPPAAYRQPAITAPPPAAAPPPPPQVAVSPPFTVAPPAAPAPVPAAVVQLPADPPAAPVATPAPATDAVPAQAVAPAAPAAPARLTEAEISAQVLQVVSGRTGYPEDMLALDADLEADLGIDSIKRVEIAGLVFEALPTPDGFTPELEKLTTSKTLRQVIDAVVGMLGVGDGAGEAATEQGAVPAGARPFDQEPTENGRVGRLILHCTAAPALPAPSGGAFTGATVLVVDLDEDGGTGAVAARVADGIRAGGGEVRLIRPGLADLADPAAVQRLVGEATAAGPLTGLIYLPSLHGATRTAGPGGSPSELTGLFLVAKALGDGLRAAAPGHAFVLAATALGGDFGIRPGVATDDPLATARQSLTGAVHGFLKTLAHEWPGVRVKAVDLAEPEAEGSPAGSQILNEAAATDGLVEVGYAADGSRLTPTLSAADHDLSAAAGQSLTRESVVLLTGGARGITAETAAELATHAAPILVLVGRTPLALEEDPATAGLTDMTAIKRALIEQARAGGAQVAPAAIERAYNSLIAEREVRATIERLRALGSTVDYRTCDVRDPEAVATLLDDVYATYGRLDGVVHGAGAIEDKLVEDKDLASFLRVVETKLAPALVLADRLRPDSLRFLAFFSSVSARFGNRGQGDYAAANEALNKLAGHLDRQWPARVVSFNWGPWQSAGMVSPEVLRQFQERGVTLIPAEEGRRAFLAELVHGDKGHVEVTIGGASGLSAPLLTAAADPAGRADLPLLAAAQLARETDGTVRLTRRLHPGVDTFLDDHRIDGAAVLPFAVAMELMAETAAAGWPELTVHRLRDVRLFSGITLDEDGTTVEVTARPRPDGNGSLRDRDVGAGQGWTGPRQLPCGCRARSGTAGGRPPGAGRCSVRRRPRHRSVRRRHVSRPPLPRPGLPGRRQPRRAR